MPAGPTIDELTSACGCFSCIGLGLDTLAWLGGLCATGTNPPNPPDECLDLDFPDAWTTGSPISSARVAAEGPGNYYAGIYNISIPAGTYTTISLISSGIDTYLYLLQGGIVVAENDDAPPPIPNGNSQITQFYSALGGSYQIQATTLDPDVVGSFDVTVDKCVSPCVAFTAIGEALTGASPFSSHIGSNDHRMKEYTFGALAGDEVLIFMKSTAFDPYLILLDPLGNVVTQQDNIFPVQTDVNPPNTGAFIHRILTLSGTYTVQATTAVAGATGLFSARCLCSCQAYTSQAVGTPGTFGVTVGELGWVRNGTGTAAFTASGGSVHMEVIGNAVPNGNYCDIITSLFANCNPYTVTMVISWDAPLTEVKVVVAPNGLSTDPVYPDPTILVEYPTDGGSTSRTVTFTCAPDPNNASGLNPYAIRFYITSPLIAATYALNATITPNTPPPGQFP